GSNSSSSLSITARLWTLRNRIIGLAPGMAPPSRGGSAARKFHPIRCLTALSGRVTLRLVCAVPAAHGWPLLFEAGPEDSFVHVWLRRLCAAGAGAAGSWDRRNRLRSPARRLQSARQERAAGAAP